MEVAHLEVPVCARCGAPATSREACPHCGADLTRFSELPTRAEWERAAGAAPARPTEPPVPARRYVVPAIALILAALAADIDREPTTYTLLLGPLGRIVSMLLIAAGIRALYVRRHPGRVIAPDTVWIAAFCAAIIAVGRLTS